MGVWKDRNKVLVNMLGSLRKCQTCICCEGYYYVVKVIIRLHTDKVNLEKLKRNFFSFRAIKQLSSLNCAVLLGYSAVNSLL